MYSTENGTRACTLSFIIYGELEPLYFGHPWDYPVYGGVLFQRLVYSSGDPSQSPTEDDLNSAVSKMRGSTVLAYVIVSFTAQTT